MLNPPLALRLEKNKLVSTAPWLLLLSVTLPDASVIRLVKNTEDVTFGGNVYIAFAFELGDVGGGCGGRCAPQNPPRPGSPSRWARRTRCAAASRCTSRFRFPATGNSRARNAPMPERPPVARARWMRVEGWPTPPASAAPPASPGRHRAWGAGE